VSAKLSVTQQFNPGVRMGVAALGCLCSFAVFAAEPAAEFTTAIGAERRMELVTLVRQDCGSCHGLTLNGGLGPALLPDALQDKPAEYLKFVILRGRPGTAMPPWQRFLTDAEAQWIVSNLQKGFPSGR